MGIQTWIRKYKERRAKKKAIKTGSTLSSLGVTSSTPRTTTGGYATPSGEVSVSSGGGVTISGGGGGSSGGGGGGSYSPSITTTSPTEGKQALIPSGTDITSLGGGGAGTSGLTAMQKFEASKSVGGINQSIMFSQQDDKSKQFFEDYSKKDLIMPEETKDSSGLDLIKKVDIKKIKKKGEKKFDLFKRDSIPSFDPSKKIIFIKPSEMKGFTEAEGYSDFDVINLTKTTEGEGGEQLDSLSDFTSNLESGSYAISLSGDMQKVKEIGVSKDTRVEYAPDGSVLYSGGVSPVTKGMTKEEIKTWKSKLKESAKFEGLDFSIKPYADVYKKEGIYAGTKYAITHPLIVKDIPVVKAGLPVVYETFLESPFKGLAKISKYQARPIMTAEERI